MKLIKPFRTYNYAFLPYADLVASLADTGCVVENLGKCSDGVNDIYGLSYGDTVNKPVIFIPANQHGSEKGAVYYVKDFMTRIANADFYDADIINDLRENFAFYAIVSCNPYGYINSKYTNFNGVNLNRNWDNNWETYNDGGIANQYKGASPFSEPETQIIRNKFLQLSPIICIDCHTSGEGPGGFDTGKKYTKYRQLLFDCYKASTACFNDTVVSVQEWNTGTSPTSVGWVGKQISKSGMPTIPTTLEQQAYYTDINYGLTSLFLLSIYASNYFKYIKQIPR